MAKYDDDALRAIREDPTQCRAMRAAAADLLDLPRTDYHKALPLRANVLDRVCDRTVGKPVQAVHIHRTEIRPPAAIGADKAPLLLQAFASLPPAERARVLEQMQAATPAVIEPIDPV